MTGTQFTDNNAKDYGGAIFNNWHNTLNVTDTQFLNNITHEHIIHANIHFIRADENKEEKEDEQFLLLNWEDFTKKAVEYYNGFGEHGEILIHDHLSRNTELITDILKNVEQHSLFFKA